MAKGNKGENRKGKKGKREKGKKRKKGKREKGKKRKREKGKKRRKKKIRGKGAKGKREIENSRQYRVEVWGRIHLDRLSVAKPLVSIVSQPSARARINSSNAKLF